MKNVIPMTQLLLNTFIHQSIQGNSLTGNEIHSLSFTTLLNILKQNIINKKEHELIKLTKNISADLRCPSTTNFNKCVFI